MELKINERLNNSQLKTYSSEPVSQGMCIIIYGLCLIKFI